MSNVHDKAVHQLNDLISLDYDAIEAYQAATDRLQDPKYKEKLSDFCADHERHTTSLGLLVAALGGTPAKGPDLMRILTKGKVLFADLVGDDYAILAAMLANEEVTNKRYEAALKVDGLGAELRREIEANLADERRHRAWIDGQLERRKARDAA